MPAMLLCSSCYTQRVVVSSNASYDRTYGTYGSNGYRTTGIKVTDYDFSRDLDLQAIVAAFSQSRDVEDFENTLNSPSNRLSNLDLNRDGYVDYLRVLETVQGRDHIFLIQAVLEKNVYQDVATLVVEDPYSVNYTVEIIGDPYLYGPACIYRPVFITRPYIFGHLCAVSYRPWHSPWYWDCYPAHYHGWRPVYYTRYHNDIHVYISNHIYCREFSRPTAVHYTSYTTVNKDYRRNDYSVKYPERSYTSRTANIATQNSAISRSEQARRSTAESTGRNSYTGSNATSTSRTATSTGSTSRNSSSTASSSRSNSTSRSRSSATNSNSGSRTSSSYGTTDSRRSTSSTSGRSSSTSSSRSGSSTSRSSSTTSSSAGTRSSSSSTRSSSSSSTRSGSSSSSSSRSSSGSGRRN